MWVLLSLLLAHSVFAQKRCGKVYKAGQAVETPEGQFPIPVTTIAQIALRCNPALIPFLPDDLTDNNSSLILVDALVRDKEIGGAQPLIMPSSPDAQLSVRVSIDGVPMASGTVPLNGSVAIPFSLARLSPRSEPYVLTCTATLPSPEQDFTSTPTRLTYLPSPLAFIGSITKLDLRTGGLLAKRAQTPDPYEPIFPVGFFTQFGHYLEGNNTALEVLKSQGISVVNPLPPYDNLTTFNLMVDKMENLGLWMIYDMRWNYMDPKSVAEQVTSFMNRKNLLLYYTAHEPDGSEDPLTAPASAAELVRLIDPYRPSSLTLNCQDYFFSEYAVDTPIIMQDAYPIGINASFSAQYNMSCTTEQGDCGCDNCVGDFEDIRNRIYDIATRLEVLGWERSKTIWSVPQAFEATGGWSRTPTGAELLVQMIVAVNAGARGSIAWNDPAATPDMKAAASTFSNALPDLTPFVLSSPLSQPPVRFSHIITPDRLDIGVWTSYGGQSQQTLVIAANLNYFSVSITLDKVVSDTTVKSRMVLDGRAKIVGTQITFGSVESGAWIFG